MHIGKFDLNLLVVFDAIYSEGSITRAAEVLHLTQPAVSHALSRLRESVDDELFIRTARGMRPTPYASALIGPVRQALAQLQRGLYQGKTFQPRELATTFRLSVRELFEAFLLPDLIQSSLTQAPNITYNCLRVPREQIFHELASGRVDLAVDVLSNADDNIYQRPLLEDQLVCLLRPQHPALGKTWNLSEMLAWPHAMVSSREHGPGFEDLQLSRHGLQRKIGLRTSHFFSAALVIAQTDLILCAPARFAHLLRERFGLSVKAMPITLPKLELYLYWHQNTHLDPAHRWLRQELVHLVENGREEESTIVGG